ncbi:MAG: hypothetical protein ACT4OY_07085 [Alphaproteobacteria bacterium]
MTVIPVNLNKVIDVTKQLAGVCVIVTGAFLTSSPTKYEPYPINRLISGIRNMEAQGVNREDIAAELDGILEGLKGLSLPENERYKVFSSYINIIKDMRQKYENTGEAGSCEIAQP